MLRNGHIQRGPWHLRGGILAHIPDHPDDSHPLVRIESALNLFAQGICVGEALLRHGLADDGNERAAGQVICTEVAPALEGNAHGLKVAGTSYAPICPWSMVLVGGWATLHAVVAIRAITAHGQTHDPGNVLDTRQCRELG